MNNNKMLAFVVMITTISVATVASVSIFSNPEKAKAYAQSPDDKSIMTQILNTDESDIMGTNENTLLTYANASTPNVMDELENIMTYDDELAFKTITATKDQMVMCSYGCSEIILIDGKAKVYSDGFYGLINIGNSYKHYQNMEIGKNQLYIMPVPDKCGVIVESDSADFLIRGGYKIEESKEVLE